MRNITEIVIHHAAVHQHDIAKILPSFDRTHFENLTKNYGQPSGGGDYPNIAYHYIITPEDVHAVRDLAVMGYHASNIRANKESIGICLSGNFDVESPTERQIVLLEDLIRSLKTRFPNIGVVRGHRYYNAGKSCPGRNFPDSLIKEVGEGKEETLPSWIRVARDWAVEEGITNGERPMDTMIRAEYWESERKKSLLEKN